MRLEAVFDPRCTLPLTCGRNRLISLCAVAQNGFGGLHPIAMSMGLAIQKTAAHRKTPTSSVIPSQTPSHPLSFALPCTPQPSCLGGAGCPSPVHAGSPPAWTAWLSPWSIRLWRSLYVLRGADVPDEDAACLRQFAGLYYAHRGGCISVLCWNSSQACRTASWFWMTARCTADTVSDPRRGIHESHTQF